MKIGLAFALLTFTSQGFAAGFIDLLPLQLQARYEDSANQAIEVIQYHTYGFAVQPGSYRLGLEFSRSEKRTGNSSLSVRTEVKEYTLTTGYEILQFMVPEKHHSLGLLLGAVLGTTQSETYTLLLGNPSTNKSGTNVVYGVATSVIGRIKYFIIETEFKILISRNFSPQVVPIAQLKLGISIPY